MVQKIEKKCFFFDDLNLEILFDLLHYGDVFDFFFFALVDLGGINAE